MFLIQYETYLLIKFNKVSGQRSEVNVFCVEKLERVFYFILFFYLLFEI